MKKKRYGILILGMALMIGVLNGGLAHADERDSIKTMIESLEVGEPVYYENLYIIPIYTTKIKDHTPYCTLEDALENKWLEISEKDGGSVPQVMITNKSDKAIYIMGGEILTGCKQDRIVGRDVLIKPGRKNITVPVYCVEAGRWHYNSKEFYSEKNLGTYRLRAKAQEADGEAQSEIWNEVAKSNQKLGVNSSTNAFQDSYKDKDIGRRIAAIEKEMKDIPQLYGDTTGVVVGVGSIIVSVDLFVNPYLFEKLWPKILKSSALSAAGSDNTGSITQQDAVNFLQSIHDRKYIKNEAIDLGFELSSTGDAHSVNALVYRGAVIHLAGFPQEKEKLGFKGPDTNEERVQVIQNQQIY